VGGRQKMLVMTPETYLVKWSMKEEGGCPMALQQVVLAAVEGSASVGCSGRSGELTDWPIQSPLALPTSEHSGRSYGAGQA
jgi:hypothetical protein